MQHSNATTAAAKTTLSSSSIFICIKQKAKDMAGESLREHRHPIFSSFRPSTRVK